MKSVFFIILAVLILEDVQGEFDLPTTIQFPPSLPTPPTPPSSRPEPPSLEPKQQPSLVDLLNKNVFTNSSMNVDLIINIIMNGNNENVPIRTTEASNPSTTLRTVDGAPTGTTPNFNTSPRTTIPYTTFLPTTNSNKNIINF